MPHKVTVAGRKGRMRLGQVVEDNRVRQGALKVL
jgi:hypothetical protein